MGLAVAKSGIDHPNFKLSHEAIDFILNNETLTRKQLAEMFDCFPTTIKRALDRFKN